MFVKVIYFHYICAINPSDMEDINRIKVVLVEKKRTNKWLAEQMGVKPSTVISGSRRVQTATTLLYLSYIVA